MATGSQLMMTVTTVISGLAMGMTVLLGQKIGEKKPEAAGKVIGSGICLFVVLALAMTGLILVFAPMLSRLLHAPENAFKATVDYVRICAIGTVFIVAFNVLDSVFRGIGDSKMPLITVAIACVVNIAGDLMLVAVFHMGAAGAAWATTFAQAMSSFVAQNVGAGKIERADKGLVCGIATSVAVGAVMFYAAFFHGDVLSSIFARDAQVIAASADYLRAYGIDCLMTAFLFCFIGYFSGMGRTLFVMMQGLIGAFCVRIPVGFAMSRVPGISLFAIGLATPTSTLVQIVLCSAYMARNRRKRI